MRKWFRFSLIVSLILSLVLLLVPASAFADNDRDSEQSGQWVLVKFQDGTDENSKHEVSLRHGDTDEGEIAGIGVHRVRIHAGRLDEKLRAYSEEKSVKYVEPDYIATVISTPNDPSFTTQWGMTKIQAPQAWDVTTGQPTIKIAILDTGIDQNHPDLASKIVINRNFSTSTTVDDLYGHGTHVAGVAAAATNNTLGVAGVGYNSVLMNVKVLSDTGSGNYSSIASGIIWATDNGAKVISMSLGGSSSSTTLQDAVNYAWSKGVVIVAAAGNNGNSGMVYPGAYQNVIAVAATDPNDAKASFSEYGSWVDVAAPGVGIYSTLPNHNNQIGALNYGSLSGTSMATPFVAGLAALVWTTPYGTTNANVRNRIESTTDRIAGTGTNWQSGRINAYQAVASTTPPPLPTPDTTPPAQVTGLTVTTASASQLNLNWNANTEPDFNSYRVYRSTVSGGPYTLVASPITNSYSNTELAAATTYYYTVSAVDIAGNEGLRSAIASGRTSNPPTVNALHVGSIMMSLSTSSGYTRAQATATILDASGMPVSGATVSGRWSGATSDSDTALTDASGRVTVQSNRVYRPRRGTTFTFTVQNVSRTGWTYNSSANTETSDFIRVP